MEQTKPRDSFPFFRSYYTSFKMLPPLVRLSLYDALCEYMFTGQEVELGKTARSHWELIKPILDSGNKNRDNGSKGGRPIKTSGFSDSETAGYTGRKSNKEKDMDKDKDKDRDRDKGKGIPHAPERRSRKSPAEPVFESLPASFERIGYAATEDLKKQTIAQLDKAAQHTTAKPPEDDPETRQLKQQFLQKTAARAAPHPNAPADTSNDTRTEASTQTPTAALSDRPTQTDPEGK